MSISYEISRQNFDNIVKKYLDYVNLYKSLNNGSAAGITDFSEFYLRMTYFSKYEDPNSVTHQRY